MSDKAEKPGSSSAGKPAPAQDAQGQAAQQPAAPERGALAVSEFALIVNQLYTVTVQAQFRSSQRQCPDKATWCLPDANCTARVTMDEKTIKAFQKNRNNCTVEAPEQER